jgi:enterochelin esterase family protein
MTLLSLLALAIAAVVPNPASPAPIHTFDEAFQILSSRGLGRADDVAIAKWFGGDLTKGSVKSEDLRFVFAISAPGADAKTVSATSDDGAWTLPLKRVGRSDLFASATTFTEGTGFHWSFVVGGNHVGGGELETYVYPPDTKTTPGAPQGVVTQQPDWKSTVYPGTTRHWWIYVPAQYDATKPACLYVIQDAQWSRGYWATVLDNLIAKKEIPVGIAVFLTPGIIKQEWDNRSIEYDTVSDRYPQMLGDEILPELYKRYNIRKDPEAHLIAGLSSGGICAFNAAWQRPDLFRKVVSWIGSFTNLQGGPTGVAGGNTYPAIIRDHRGWDKKGEPKPIRVYLQDGTNDLDNKAGTWPLSNQQMFRALQYGGYDVRFELGHGFHSDKMGRARLPDTLRWMWRDEPK